MTDKTKIVIDEINTERKSENELLEFDKTQKNIAKYIKIVYDDYIDQGFTTEQSLYLTGVWQTMTLNK